jgi:hypothetical protein
MFKTCISVNNTFEYYFQMTNENVFVRYAFCSQLIAFRYIKWRKLPYTLVMISPGFFYSILFIGVGWQSTSEEPTFCFMPESYGPVAKNAWVGTTVLFNALVVTTYAILLTIFKRKKGTYLLCLGAVIIYDLYTGLNLGQIELGLCATVLTIPSQPANLYYIHCFLILYI